MPPSVLQDVLTEGDTGAPFFSDRDGSETVHATERTNPYAALERLRLRIVRAEMLGHRTVPIDDLKQILAV